jgi:polyhydroxyalkanoate synthesis repressor PhaR
MPILIKRYANRKLYNTASSRYITLKGIAELIDAGEEVRVIDNETGEDITKVALSQILVDSERGNQEVPRNLLSELVQRGGDVLYGALRGRMDDAREDFEELQDRVRRLVRPEREGRAPRSLSDWIAYAAPDFDHLVQNAVERVFKLLDLPRREDIDALNRNLDRVAAALEALEKRTSTLERRARPDVAPPSEPPGA